MRVATHREGAARVTEPALGSPIRRQALTIYTAIIVQDAAAIIKWT
jgi:hypothetical protein